MNQEKLNKLVDLYFCPTQNGFPKMYRHLHESFDDLMQYFIPKIVEEYTIQDVIQDGKRIIHKLCVSNIKVRLPTDEYQKEYITPQVARERNLTYSCSLYGDMVIKSTHYNLKTSQVEVFEKTSKNVFITKIPSMVKSSYCVLNLFPEKQHEECYLDPGGYFIVNGNEKVVVSVERQVSNKLLYFSKDNTYVVSINSQKSETNIQIQQMSILLKNDTLGVTSNIFSSEVSLIAVLRSMGLVDDTQIFKYIMRRIDDKNIMNILYNSITNCLDDKGNIIMTQEDAIEHLFSKLSYSKIYSVDTGNEKNFKKTHLFKLYDKYIIPNINHHYSKSKFLTYMVNRLLYNFSYNENIFYERDSYENKRIDTPGILISKIFNQAWCKMLKPISLYFIKKNTDHKNPINVINQLKPYYIEQFIKSSLLTGNWGISKNKKGVSRIVNRLSFMKAVSDLRKIIIPSVDDKTKKITSMRQVHPTQVGYICVVDTPEGEKVGVVKALSVQASVTPVDIISGELVEEEIRSHKDFISIMEMDPDTNMSSAMVLINGVWIGSFTVSRIYEIYQKIVEMKLCQKISRYTSVYLDIDNQELVVQTDSGRLTRPLFRVNNELQLYLSEKSLEAIKGISSFEEFMIKYPDIIEYVDINQALYNLVAEDIKTLERNRDLLKNSIALTESEREINKYHNSFHNFSHCEFHPCMILSICASTIPFCNHNQAPRNTYHCIQIKQAMCIHSTSHKNRIDITNVLKDPQVPICKPMMLKHIGLEEMPYGKNVILAIIPFTGYNQEDSMILNKSSVERGLFDSASFRGFESVIEKNHSTAVDDIFTKPDKELTMHMKNEVKYDKIDDTGIVREETLINTNDVMIGKVSPMLYSENSLNKMYKDKSTVYKSLTPCYIDKVIKNTNADGYDMCKLKTRSSLTPMIGDKFTSRHGQKATCGILLRTEDMPFTKDGLVPDIIINANCIPSRMTIGQLYEVLVSKAGSLNGEFYDATPFEDIDIDKYRSELEKWGYNKSGKEDMYSGITGEKYTSEIFIGPCYYTRLKQIVSEKIHARSIGSTQILTRQPPEGRSRNGGLRFGEMERDACIAHGTSYFLKEIMMESSDAHTMHICDICGFFASKMKRSEKYYCRKCDNVLRISKISIPYCFKLMIQELKSIHVVMRLRTTSSYE